MALFKNARIFGGDRFFSGSFRVENGLFTHITEGGEEGPGTDLGGALVLPGLVDLHIHGSMGADFSDGDPEGLRTMARYLAKNGITGFAPTSMTLPYDTLERAYRTGREIADEAPEGCARILGIHMEGPFFSEKKKGAQNAENLRLPDYDFFRGLQEAGGGLLRIADVAPELPGAEEFCRKASKTCRVSLAHTDASWEDAAKAFEAGARHVTHLFNAMPPLHHRRPGVIGAAAERDDVVVELICDGLHVHPSVIRLTYRLFPERVCMISDALRCCGMPEGAYELGGQQVYLKGNLATLRDGTIAGSATNLYDCLRTVIRSGVSPEQAIRSATLIPARELGCEDRLGSIGEGKYADFIVADESFNRREVYLGGVKL